MIHKQALIAIRLVFSIAGASDLNWKPMEFYVYIMSCHMNPVIMKIQKLRNDISAS
jgi:hypothetical protein